MISTFLIPKVLIPATLFWLITFTSDQKTPWNLFLVSCINLFIDFDFLIVNLYRKMVFNSLNSLIVINFTSSTFYLHAYTQTIWFTFAMKKNGSYEISAHLMSVQFKAKVCGLEMLLYLSRFFMRTTHSMPLFSITGAHIKCFPHLLPTWHQGHRSSCLGGVHRINSILYLEILIHWESNSS